MTIFLVAIIVVLLAMMLMSEIRVYRGEKERSAAWELAERAAASEAKMAAQLQRWVDDYTDMYAEYCALRRIARDMQGTFAVLVSEWGRITGQPTAGFAKHDLKVRWADTSLDDLIAEERAKVETE